MIIPKKQGKRNSFHQHGAWGIIKPMRKKRLPAICLLIFLVFISEGAFSSPEAAYKYNEEGLKKIKQGDFEGAINAFKSANLYEPSNKAILTNLAVAYNNYGFALMKNGQLNKAIQNLEKAVYYEPGNAYALYNLGQAYYNAQNMPGASRCLERAVKLNPDLQGALALLNKINGESSVEDNFERTETMRFIIASARDIPVASFSYIRTYLEEAYGRIGMFLGYYPKNKIVVVLYSESNYDAMLKGRPHWALAAFDGKVRIPVNRFKYTNDEVIKIIYHEYAHAVLYELAREKCPLWFQEGIAGKAEDFATPKNKGLVRKYIDKFGLMPITAIPSDFTSIKDVNRATALYIESYLIVDFIIRKKGYAGIKNIINYLKDGYAIEKAISIIFQEDLSSFEKMWIRYVIEEYSVDSLKAYNR